MGKVSKKDSNINYHYDIKLLSSLDKVFLDEEPKELENKPTLSGLWGETVSFQVAYRGDFPKKERAQVVIDSKLSSFIRVRKVEQVPVQRATNVEVDDGYLKLVPGLYPDLLRDIKDGQIEIFTNQWKSLWIDVQLNDSIKAGIYPIQIKLVQEEEILCLTNQEVKVIGVHLPKQKLIHTEWFHADCLADYYKVEVFSDEHFEIIKNFFVEYVDRGCNMIMTPLFTTPLDTDVGGERTTTQLIDVRIENGEYIFGFERLKRYLDLASGCGIEYFEMSHLFTQWGAKYAPKIVAKVDGQEKKIFGWHTPAVGEYTQFLHQFLPQLTAKLKEWKLEDRTYFHISDEPREEDFESYKAAKQSLGNLLDDFTTIDVLSDYEFYQKGLIPKPIPGNDQVEEFHENGVKKLWSYYCTMQSYLVSNRYMSMPSARNRIYGTQLYKYEIEGILHWGYNFYNSQYSTEHINPYLVTDALGGFPAGDAFLVYPGEDRCPEESIRMMVHYQGLNDLRALQLLEDLKGKEFVMNLIEGDLDRPLTFKIYPRDDFYILNLRNRVNEAIETALK